MPAHHLILKQLQGFKMGQEANYYSFKAQDMYQRPHLKPWVFKSPEPRLSTQRQASPGDLWRLCRSESC